MTTHIVLPAYLSARSAAETIRICRQIQASGDDIQLDAQRLNFVDPFGIALLGASFDAIRRDGRQAEVCRLNQKLSGYLQRMDLLRDVHLVDCPETGAYRNDRSDSLMELTMLSDQHRIGETAERLAKILAGEASDADPDEPPDEMSGFTTYLRWMEPIQYVLNETLENALTHARRQGYRHASVWIASQYYPSPGKVYLAVVDNGCGMLATLREHPELKQQTEHAAILMALQPRISCNRDLRMGMESVNQGVGLTTASRIVQKAGGGMIIVSGNGIHDTQGRSGAISDTWQGVALSMCLRRDLLPDIRYKELLPPYEGQIHISLRFE